MKMAFLTGKASFFVLVLVLVSLRSISALSQDGSDRDALKLILGSYFNLFHYLISILIISIWVFV